MSTTVTNATSTTSTASTASLTGNAATLTQQQFLELLTAKLQNQDPLSVESQEDFLAQLAQIQTYSQSISLNEAIQSLSLQQGITGGSLLLGCNVGYNDESGNSCSGTVTSVKISDGTVQAVIDGATSVDMSDITNIAYASSEA